MLPYSIHHLGMGIARPITVAGESSLIFLNTAVPTPVCDEQGQVLGTFFPAPVKIPDWITPELLAEREAEGGGRPLAEIMADLEQQDET